MSRLVSLWLKRPCVQYSQGLRKCPCPALLGKHSRVLDGDLFWHLWCKSGTGQSSFPQYQFSNGRSSRELHLIYNVQMGMPHDTRGLKRKRRHSWLRMLLLVVQQFYFQIQNWEWSFIRLLHFTYDKTEARKWLNCPSPTLGRDPGPPNMLWTTPHTAICLWQKRDHGGWRTRPT